MESSGNKLPECTLLLCEVIRNNVGTLAEFPCKHTRTLGLQGTPTIFIDYTILFTVQLHPENYLQIVLACINNSAGFLCNKDAVVLTQATNPTDPHKRYFARVRPQTLGKKKWNNICLKDE